MASNDASRLVTTTPPAITTSSPPTATMPTLADASGGTPANSSQNGKPKVKILKNSSFCRRLCFNAILTLSNMFFAE